MAGALKGLIEGLEAANKRLQFLHNTDASRIARFEEIGGMPVPSLAVTRQDIPFDNFGDITLVGKPDAFNPRSSATNKVFSADAYTSRSPQPIRVANKDAYSRFQAMYPGARQDVSYALGDLSTKKSMREGDYDRVTRFFEDDDMAISRFISDEGIEIPSEISLDKYATKNFIRDNLGAEHRAWANGQMDELFQPGEFFISNPNRDYYTTGPRLKPYTADEITSYMRRNAGRNTEGGLSNTGFGAQRASTTEQFTSMGQMRQNMDNLAPSEAIDALKEGQKEEFFSIADELRPYYKYDANGFGYLDEMSELVQMSERSGMNSALNEIGFENVPDDVLQRLNRYKDSLRSAPTQYFEAKPTRNVGLDEFGGAIVPEGTPQQTLDILERRGVPYEKYTTPEERTALRQRFSDTAFSAAPVALGLGGLGLLGSEDAEAGVAKKAADAVLDMSHAARMQRARDMGFDRDVFHKTWSDNFVDEDSFAAFDPTRMQQSDYGYAGKGVYATKHPLSGNTYGDVTMPLKTNIQNPYIRNADNWGDELDPYIWIPENSSKFDSMEDTSAAWTEMMQGKGFDGFIDEATQGGEIVIFDPKNIRSVNAAFDPAKKDSANLLASAAGVGTTGLLGAAALAPEGAQASMYQQPDQRQDNRLTMNGQPMMSNAEALNPPMPQTNTPMAPDHFALPQSNLMAAGPRTMQSVRAPDNMLPATAGMYLGQLNRRLEQRGLGFLKLEGLEDYVNKAAYDPHQLNYGDRLKATLDVMP